MIKAEDFQKVLKRLDELEKEVQSLKTDNQQLKKLLESSSKTTPKPALSYKQVVSGGRIDDEAPICFLASARREAVETTKRQRNLVISGLKPPAASGSDRDAEDNEQINNVLKKLEANEHEVRATRRIKNKSGEHGTLVIVEMVDETARNRVLKKAPNLAGTDVFINRDMTHAEQAIERELRADRNHKNSKLEHSNGKFKYGTDDKNRKYYYGIRSGVVKQIFIRE